MPLQSENLAVVALGVVADQPPEPFQPPLADGMHFRWAFDPARGFPWGGYFLFSRRHIDPKRTCIATLFDPKWTPGPLGSPTLPLAADTLDSDAPLIITEQFAASGKREFDLRGRDHLRFALGEDRRAREFHVTVGALGETHPGNEGDGPKEEASPLLGCLAFAGPLLRLLRDPSRPAPPARAQLFKVTGFDGAVPMASATLSILPGQSATAALFADRMDSVRIEGAAGVLIDICFALVEQDVGAGWERLPGFAYPLCLPSAEAGYPCPGKPATRAQAEAMALARIRYGPAAPWAPTRVSALCDVVDDLVANGPPPTGLAMADRSASYPDALGDPNAPIMPDQRPLDLLQMGAINPAIAQMLGLYWTHDPGDSNAYDYLLLADHSGRFGGDPDAAVAAMAEPLPDDVDGWICFGRRKLAAPPLAPPADVQVFALPGSGTDPALIAQDLVHAAGLRWRIDQTPEGDLFPDAPVGYHLWRADIPGDATPTTPPAAYAHITAGGMILVAAPSASGAHASDWPPRPMHRIDARLPEGWYSYRASAMDIFGRTSAKSAPASWRQWTPEPQPRPWYYVDPPSDAEIHPFAVHLLSKTPPPAVAGLEAWALDPLDPSLAGDPAFDAWRAVGWWDALPAADQAKRTGLRVRWRWEPAQMIQAPRLKEFRLYLGPGGTPAPGYLDRRAWPERVHVVDAATHFTPLLDANNLPTGGRLYEVLLPEDFAAQDFASVPLEATDADPIVYSHVGVSAADDRLHTSDDPQWGNPWGGRDGNQGPVAIAKIYRVLRAPPPAPPVVGFDDKVWATRADYHGVSRYTFRWARPATGQKVHVFRSVDDTLYRADWERRRAANPAAFQLGDVQPFGWGPVDCAAVLAELGAPIDAVAGLDWNDDPIVRAAYEALSERALRVLASFAGNDGAFVQTTFEPLDPADAAHADRAGPDATAPYAPDPALGAWTAAVDGRASNRYFFRAAYVNSAHIVGLLGPSSPAVYLPKVQPPRAPAITRVTSGELAVTLAWAHNREPDFAEYRLYRADDARQARDARLMTRLLTLARVDVDETLPAVEWADATGLIGGRTYVYCLTSVDAEGNESEPSARAAAMAVDSRPPEPPVWTATTWMLRSDLDDSPAPWPDDGVTPVGTTPALSLTWISGVADAVFAIGRRHPGDATWTDVSGAIFRPIPADSTTYALVDRDADPRIEAEYRIRVRAPTGLWSTDYSTVEPIRPEISA